MFNICFIGTSVVENEEVVKGRITKSLEFFVEKGGMHVFIGGNLSFASLVLSVCSKVRKKNHHLRYLFKPAYHHLYEMQDRYKKMIDDSEVIISYYDPAKNELTDNIFFNYAKKRKKMIINLFQGKKLYWFGELVDEISGEYLKEKIKECLKMI